ncbi:MAG: hypothetical protein H6656_17300 [Ardenticatenaceae bacterium]|nr:hypothetical protein [Ardenticatenaceae bacterium]
MVDPDTANGKALIEIYHHNSQKPSPKFSLSEDNDPQWFFFFKEQFDLMWEQCEIQSPFVNGKKGIAYTLRYSN